MNRPTAPSRRSPTASPGRADPRGWLRLAIPCRDGRPCPHLGRADAFELVDVLLPSGRVDRRRHVPRPRPSCDGLAPWLVELGVTDVLAVGAGASAIDALRAAGIRVTCGCDTAGDPVAAFLDGPLPTGPNPCAAWPRRTKHCREG